MTVGNLAALTQSNMKRLLAYSSIAHAGYLLIGIVAATPRGVVATLIYLFVYASCSWAPSPSLSCCAVRIRSATS